MEAKLAASLGTVAADGRIFFPPPPPPSILDFAVRQASTAGPISSSVAGNAAPGAPSTAGGAATGPGNSTGNPIETAHEDMIHDAQLDYYGKRLATCSSDRTVRVFNVSNGHAVGEGAVLRGHSGPVWQVAWAHPSFGGILASCSYDGRVFVWKEVAPGSGSAGGLRSESNRCHATSAWPDMHRRPQAMLPSGKRSRSTCCTRHQSTQSHGHRTNWVPSWHVPRAMARCRC